MAEVSAPVWLLVLKLKTIVLAQNHDSEGCGQLSPPNKPELSGTPYALAPT